MRLFLTLSILLCISSWQEVHGVEIAFLESGIMGSADCATATLLCGPPTSISVASPSGTGADSNELDPGNCLQGLEKNSTWYKFTAATNGPLEFNLVPINPTADLDFVFFELSNGLDDCSGKTILRCMASGENSDPNRPFDRCTGSTGMRLGDGDTEEAKGCEGDDNNYVEAVNLQAGRAYALLIIKVSDGNSGFTLDWGATSVIFSSPIAIINTDNVRQDCNSVVYQISTVNAPGVNFQWDFGQGASPGMSTGAGPFQVSYAGQSGQRTVRLEAMLANCSTTNQRSLNVTLPSELRPEVTSITPTSCGQDTSGSFTIVLDPPGDFEYQLNTGERQTSGLFTGLSAGTYSVTIRQNGSSISCIPPVMITIPEGTQTPAQFSSLEVMSTSCMGKMDGQVVATAPAGSLFALDGGAFQQNGTFTSLDTGVYTVSVQNADACIISRTARVIAGPELNLGSPQVTDASCQGSIDGEVVLPQGGSSYVFESLAARPTNTFTNLPPGTYRYTIRAADGCTQTGSVKVGVIELDFSIGKVLIEPSSCGQSSDGAITITPQPGRSYELDGILLTPPYRVSTLRPGRHTLMVSNAAGCTTDTVFILSAGQGFQVDLGTEIQVNFGDSVRIVPQLSIEDSLVQSYAWRLSDSTVLSREATFSFLPTQSPQLVSLSVADVNACVAEAQVLIRLLISPEVGIPTAFSPNGDLRNDLFTVFGNDQLSAIATLKVFDRWGALLFAAHDLPANDASVGWDGLCQGEACPLGSYVYVIELEYVDASRELFTGVITLMR